MKGWMNKKMNDYSYYFTISAVQNMVTIPRWMDKWINMNEWIMFNDVQSVHSYDIRPKWINKG